jgi:hypothetical protein
VVAFPEPPQIDADSRTLIGVALDVVMYAREPAVEDMSRPRRWDALGEQLWGTKGAFPKAQRCCSGLVAGIRRCRWG